LASVVPLIAAALSLLVLLVLLSMLTDLELSIGSCTGLLVNGLTSGRNPGCFA
jgi:hypothetical protein